MSGELGKLVHELRLRTTIIPTHSQVDPVIVTEPRGILERELIRQHRVVPHIRVDIQWDVRGVHRDVVLEQSPQTVTVRTHRRFHRAPKQTVMHQEEIGARRHGVIDGMLARVNRGHDF